MEGAPAAGRGKRKPRVDDDGDNDEADALFESKRLETVKRMRANEEKRMAKIALEVGWNASGKGQAVEPACAGIQDKRHMEFLEGVLHDFPFSSILYQAQRRSQAQSQGGLPAAAAGSRRLLPDSDFPTVCGHFSRLLKPHQWEGVRFLWKNIFEE